MAKKIGRNELCPCGSGKKYKKCCLGKDEQLKVKLSILNYVNRFLTYEEVNEMSTGKIISKLEAIGIPFNQDIFLKDIENSYSAEELSENWFNQYTVTATGKDEDFPWLAAWILWERLAPGNKLSMEHMGNLIDKGYDSLAKNNSMVACDTWLVVWDAIKERNKPTFKSLEDLDKHYRGSFFLRNFCQDLEMELHNAGLEDCTYFEKRITYCREFCDYFLEEREMIHSMRCAIAKSYVKLDQYQKAESEFERLIQEYPSNPWGYIHWGDIFFLEKDRPDYNRAHELYKKALAIAEDKTDIEIIKERIEDVKEEYE